MEGVERRPIYFEEAVVPFLLYLLFELYELRTIKRGNLDELSGKVTYFLFPHPTTQISLNTSTKFIGRTTFLKQKTRIRFSSGGAGLCADAPVKPPVRLGAAPSGPVRAPGLNRKPYLHRFSFKCRRSTRIPGVKSRC
jgi:hypothetical protein